MVWGCGFRIWGIVGLGAYGVGSRVKCVGFEV